MSSNPILDDLRATKAKHERMVAFHTGLVGIYEGAIQQADALAGKFGMELQNGSEASIAPAIPKVRPGRKPAVQTAASEPSSTAPKNKSQAIKSYFDVHGLDVKPKQVIKAIKDEHGLTVTVGLVSGIKSKMKSGVDLTPKKRGRKPGTASKKASATTKKTRTKTANDDEMTVAAKGAEESDLPLATIIQEALEGCEDGLKLDALAVECLKRGYVYNGKHRQGTKDWHSAVVQNVYQATNDLMKEKERRGFTNKVPVVIRDEASHRYFLNPKAKKKSAA